MKAPRSSRWQLALTVLVLAGALAFVIVRYDAVVDAYVRLTRWFEEHVRHAGLWGAIAFVVFAALSVLLGPFTSGPLTPAAVIVWGRGVTLAMLFGGWMLGNTFAYAIGRYGAHPLLRRFVPWRKIEDNITKLPKRKTLVLAILVRMTLPSEVGYAYGALRFNFVSYLVLTVLAELPTALLLVYGSEALLSRKVTQLIAITAAGFGMLLVAWIVRWALRHDGRGEAPSGGRGVGGRNS